LQTITWLGPNWQLLPIPEIWKTWTAADERRRL
jgi:hypothetical protein